MKNWKNVCVFNLVIDKLWVFVFGYWKNVDLCVCVLKSVGFCICLFEKVWGIRQKNQSCLGFQNQSKKKKSAKKLKKKLKRKYRLKHTHTQNVVEQHKQQQQQNTRPAQGMPMLLVMLAPLLLLMLVPMLMPLLSSLQPLLSIWCMVYGVCVYGVWCMCM